MKKLLLHACCAPCSSGVVPQLKDYEITLLFYNPNIDTEEEYILRVNALKQYVEKYNLEYKSNLKYIICPYNHNEFIKNISSLENEPERGKRCGKCIGLRLKATAEYAKNNGYDIFSSTLSVSPHKDHELINNLGNNLAKEFEVEYLNNNFKKNNGYLNSINNSKKYGIYRQNYCGCEFAKSHLTNNKNTLK